MRVAAHQDEQISALLADPQYQDHPLREPLARLFNQLQDQVRQLDRITRISDGYQSAARRESRSLTERLNKQVRQLEKIARISDRYQAMLQDLNKRLERESTHDALTGLANRRLVISRLSTLIEDQHTPLCIALVDVDHFKLVNDAHGHEAGDQALLAIARALQAPLGHTDLVARWGGEEFLLIWPRTLLLQARQWAEELRLEVTAGAARIEGESLRSTASFGLAQWQPGETINALLRRADGALYAAKHAGRDQVMVAT